MFLLYVHSVRYECARCIAVTCVITVARVAHVRAIAPYLSLLFLSESQNVQS